MFFNRPCEYYTYNGSLTTPPCLETVKWMIFKNPILVTEDAVSNPALCFNVDTC